MKWSKPLEKLSVLQLADTVPEAMRRMAELNQLLESLPGLDCGTCGTPSCRALAEDIVRGNADINDCVFHVRDEMTDKNAYIPLPFRKSDEGDKK